MVAVSFLPHKRLLLYCLTVLLAGGLGVLSCQKDTASSPLSSPSPAAAQAGSDVVIHAECSDTHLRVRENPDTRSSVLGQLNSPDTVKVLSRTHARVRIGDEWDFWLHILYEGRPAWSYAAWLVPDVPMEEVPVHQKPIHGWTVMGALPHMDLFPYPAINAPEHAADRIVDNVLLPGVEPLILQDGRLHHAELLLLNTDEPRESLSISAVDPEGTRFEAELSKADGGFSVADLPYKRASEARVVHRRTVSVPFYVPGIFVSGKWEISVALDTGQVVHQTVDVTVEDISVINEPVLNPFLANGGGKPRRRVLAERGKETRLHLANQPPGSQVPLVLYRGEDTAKGMLWYPVCGTYVVTDAHGRGQTQITFGRDLPEGIYHFSWRDLKNPGKGYMDSMVFFDTIVGEG